MKSTGVVRKIDELGRVVLPSEIRKVFGIHEGDQLDISVDGEKVILEKRRDLCVFCSAESPEVDFKGRRVCQNCLQELAGVGRIVRLPEGQTVTAR